MSHTLLFCILLFACLADLCLPLLLGRKYPGYNHLVHTISTLGTRESPVQRYQCANLILVGVLFSVFALGQQQLFRQPGWAHAWYTAGVLVYGIGCVLAGLFPEDPQDGEKSVSGKIHGIGSGLGFLLLILVPLWATWMPELARLAGLNAVLFGLGLITFALFLASAKRSSGFLKYSGLFQRLNLLLLYAVLLINLPALAAGP